jgi:glucose/arabinose dehydrogenase
MKKVHLAALTAVACTVAILAVPTHGQQNVARDTSPRVLDVQGGKIRVVTVATGLFHPWSVAFVDAQTILVAERNGKLRMIRGGVLSPDIVWASPSSNGPNGDALHGLALHPQFSQNSLVYVSYPKRGERGTTIAIGRGHLKNSKIEDVEEIFVADAWETGGNLAGRILFGPTLRSISPSAIAIASAAMAQTTTACVSRRRIPAIISARRCASAMTVPHRPNNPLVGRAGAKPEVFTTGHRNGYGLAFNPETGENCGRQRLDRWAATRSIFCFPATTMVGR